MQAVRLSSLDINAIDNNGEVNLTGNVCITRTSFSADCQTDWLIQWLICGTVYPSLKFVN